MVLTEQGFYRPTYAELLDEQISRAKKLFGDDIDTSELTALGKFMRLNVYDVSGLYEMLEYVYYARFPATATGISLDRLCLFAGLSRNPATEALHIVRIYGEAETDVKAGEFLVGTTDNITFYLVNDATLAATELTEDVVINGQTVFYQGETVGVADGEFCCVDVGAIGNVPIGSINRIINPNVYVTAIKHISLNKVGEEIETDVSLRRRFEQTISAIGNGTIDSIYGAILRVSGVTGCYIVENDTDTTDSSGRPSKSFECYVLGGNDDDIAQAIFSKIPVGIETVSTVDSAHQVSKQIADVGGTLHTINFSRTIEKLIYIKITVAVDTHFESTGVDDIKSNLIQHLAGLTNGEDVIYSSLFGDVHSVEGVKSATIQLSTNGTAYSTNNITCSGSEVARSNTDIISVEVTNYVDS